MFDTDILVARRRELREAVDSGLIVFLGHDDSPINFADNTYHFRQDSSFLYYWGLDSPGLAATIDVEEDTETLYGDDLTVDDIVWTGPKPALRARSERVGVRKTLPFAGFGDALARATASGRTVHFLPQYRPDCILKLQDILKVPTEAIRSGASADLIKAVVRQRSIKSADEIAQIELALNTTYVMQTYAMKHVRAGVVEQEIAGALEGIAFAGGGHLAFPTIFSINGQTLHIHSHANVMKSGDIAVCDCGASSPLHYAGDITRTIPVSGKYTEVQKDIYQIVLGALELGINKTRPGIRFVEAHSAASAYIADGLKSLGLMKGDTSEAVEAGAHALFFPHGLGHMLGLDVHDMESLGEDNVGYDEQTRRSTQFGLNHLRLGKELQAGYVLTVEPGLYFIPQLIDMWKSQDKLSQFIDYSEVEKYRTFGGVRIEENVFVTPQGNRVLGNAIPRTVADVELIGGQRSS